LNETSKYYFWAQKVRISVTALSIDVTIIITDKDDKNKMIEVTTT
jgi:hypothetical protein